MKVTILLLEQISMFELGCALELFALPRPELTDWYQTKVVSLKASSFNGLCDTQFSCEQVDNLPNSDLLVVPSFPVEQHNINKQIAVEIKKHVDRGGRIISFCSGAFLLAALGLLEGRTVTTHWKYAELFKQRFPNLAYKDDILYSYDGVIGCSAGSAAGIDLGIEVIRQDHGHDVANSVARRLVLPAHRSGGQAQFVEKPLMKSKSTLSSAMDWAVINLSAKLTISEIAEKASMSRRTFDRQFNKHYNMTPLTWLLHTKLDIAKSLLETTHYSIERIAEQSGFESTATLRHNFKKYLSISPRDYRLKFKVTN